MAWRRFGPEAAIHRFIMKLRMALLSADYVYVDRNQLLDGMCFLSLGPDGIAEALGIPRFQDLPLVVGCEAPTPPAGGFARPGDAQERAQWIALQRSRVESETFVSAAYAALNASGDTEASAASARRAQLCTLLADLEECDSEDIGSYPAYVRLPRRRREAEVLVATGRDQWQSAMESLRVHLISWPRTPRRRRNRILGASRQDRRPRRSRGPLDCSDSSSLAPRMDSQQRGTCRPPGSQGRRRRSACSLDEQCCAARS